MASAIAPFTKELAAKHDAAVQILLEGRSDSHPQISRFELEHMG